MAEGSPNRPVRDKWALIVGIGQFQSPNIPKLKYAAKDARDFREFLIREANFAPDHVRILTDEKATQRRVLSELGSKFLARVAKPDDLVLLFFSTHGSPAQADVRGKNFVVAYDSDPDDLYTTGIEMDKILESIQSRVLSERVLLILDACHSGAVTANAKGLARPVNFDADALAQGSGQMVICSSLPDQQSWESKRYQNGIFTRKLLDALRMKGQKTTLGDALPFVQQSVAAEVQEDYGSRQSPSLRSKWNGNDLVLAAVPAAPQPVPAAVKQLLQPDSSVASAKPSTPAAVASLTSSGNAGDWRKGVALFKRGDYGSAVDVLTKATKGAAKNDADAHYHLGNALMRTNHYAEAIKAWKESYRLKSEGSIATHCLQLISFYSGMAKAQTAAVASASKFTHAGSGRTAGGAEVAAPVGEWKPPKSYLDPMVVAQVQMRMPRIPNTRVPERVILRDLASWSAQDKANYTQVAADRVDIAYNELEQGQKIFAQAKAVTTALISNRRAYGETEETFKLRMQEGQAMAAKLMQPYVNDLDLRSRKYDDETALLNACQAAQKQLLGAITIYPRCKNK
jgi:uncharacterized caspase-like protein